MGEFWGRSRSDFVEVWMVEGDFAKWKTRMCFGSVLAECKISPAVLVTSDYILDMLTT